MAWTKEQHNAWKRAWYVRNREKVIKRARAYRKRMKNTNAYLESRIRYHESKVRHYQRKLLGL